MRSLLLKDIMTELRYPQFLVGVLFFQFLLVLIFYMFQEGALDMRWWSNLFWVNVLIASISLTLKNFMAESRLAYAYYYQLTDPLTIFISKAIYNWVLICLVCLMNLALFSSFFDPNPQSVGTIILITLIGSLGISAAMTMVSFIASFGQHAGMLINVLVIPILIPLMLISIAITRDVGMGVRQDWLGDLRVLLGVVMLIMAMTIALFPYLWRK